QDDWMNDAGMDQVERRIANRKDAMASVTAMVERFGAEHAFTAQAINDVNVALDEVLSNIISYGYRSGAHDEILVRLQYRPGEVVIEIEDAGEPFDPLAAPPPDPDASVKTRKVGGLGIHFVRNLVDEMAYVRVDGKNRLRLSKKLST